MAKNKQQLATEARAKKAIPEILTNPAGHPVDAVVAASKEYHKSAEPVPAATPAPAAPAQPSKHQLAIEKLREGWTAKGVNLDKLSIKDDGKFKVLVVDQGWPRITIGPTGGIVVTDLKSYASAFDAAMDGLALYEKQKSREAKKQQATAPAQPVAQPAAVKQTATA